MAFLDVAEVCTPVFKAVESEYELGLAIRAAVPALQRFWSICGEGEDCPFAKYRIVRSARFLHRWRHELLLNPTQFVS